MADEKPKDEKSTEKSRKKSGILVRHSSRERVNKAAESEPSLSWVQMNFRFIN